jgi:hypothetical protein
MFRSAAHEGGLLLDFVAELAPLFRGRVAATKEKYNAGKGRLKSFPSC